MNKKSLDEKVATKFITESRNNGMTDQEIYNELSQQNFDKQLIASLVAFTVTSEKRRKYRIHRCILFGLIAITALLSLLSSVDSFSDFVSDVGDVILVIIIMLFVGFYIFMLIKFEYKTAYSQCSFLSFLILLSSFVRLNSQFVSYNYKYIIMQICMALIAVLSYYISRKMFPNRRLKKLKRDSNGEYIFDERE